MNYKKSKDTQWQEDTQKMQDDINLKKTNGEIDSELVEDEKNSDIDTEIVDDSIDVEVLGSFDEADTSEELAKAKAQLSESNDRFQRMMAEFDNFRKRTLKEKASMFENGAKEVLEKLLPVVDNFERALSHVTEDEKELGITQGVDKIYKQFISTLNELGVEEIDAHHKEFDPNFHHAVSHEENEDYDDNLVQEVYQKGYLYKESVLRYSMVKVVN